MSALALVATSLGVLGLVAGPASAASQAQQKMPLSKVNAISCDGSTPEGASTKSFANIKVTEEKDGDDKDNKPDTKVVATITLNDVAKNTELWVSLTQAGPTTSCGGVGNNVTTNGDGDLTVTLSAKKLPNRDGAYVSVIGPGPVLISQLYAFED